MVRHCTTSLTSYELIQDRPKGNRENNAHDIDAKLVGASTNRFESFFHFVVDSIHAIVDTVHLVIEVIQHDGLSLDFFSLQRRNIGQILDTFPDFVELSVKICVSFFERLNLLLLVVRNGHTASASGSRPRSSFGFA